MTQFDPNVALAKQLEFNLIFTLIRLLRSEI